MITVRWEKQCDGCGAVETDTHVHNRGAPPALPRFYSVRFPWDLCSNCEQRVDFTARDALQKLRPRGVQEPSDR